jgi:hypothetical protein
LRVSFGEIYYLRDKRVVEMMRQIHREDLKPPMEKFERTGDLIYWDRCV